MAFDNPRPSSQPEGSTDLVVAKDNLITLDLLANSTDPTVTNRKGQVLKTFAGTDAASDAVIAGIQADGDAAIDELIAQGELDIATAIAAAGYAIVGDFADAVKVQITSDNQVYTSKSIVGYESALWRTNQVLPYTPTGSDPTQPPESGKWLAVQVGEIKAVARSLNVPDNAVIYGLAGQVITAEAQYLYNPFDQTTWGITDGVAAGEVIISVSGSDLVTSGGSYTLISFDGGAIVATNSTEQRTLGDRFADTVNVLDNGITGGGDETLLFQAIIDSHIGESLYIPEGVNITINLDLIDLSNCAGLFGKGSFTVVRTTGFVSVPDNFIVDGLAFNGPDSWVNSFRIEGGSEGTDESTWSTGVTIRNCTFRNSGPEGETQQYLCFYAARMTNMSFVNNKVTRGSSWFREILGVVITGNNIDADSAGTEVRSALAGADCLKLTAGTWGTVSGNVLENAGRDGIDAFSSGEYLVITGNTIRNFYTEGIEIKSTESADDLAKYVTISGNVICSGGYDSAAQHAAIWVNDTVASVPNSIHDIVISGNVISDIGKNAGAGGVYQGIRATNLYNVTISDNIITDITNPLEQNYGIQLAGSTNFVVSGNVISCDDRGITASGLSNGIISDNYIATNYTPAFDADFGLYISGSNNENVTISGNKIEAVNRAFNSEGAILENYTIVNNTFSNQVAQTIYLSGIINSKFIGNTIDGSGAGGSDGVRMDGTGKENLIVQDNFFTNCRYGFYLRESVGSVLTGNIADNVAYCIFVSGGDYNIIKNNIVRNNGFSWQSPIGANSIVSDNLRIV